VELGNGAFVYVQTVNSGDPQFTFGEAAEMLTVILTMTRKYPPSGLHLGNLP
jgi:hypothetical protein